MEPIKFWRIMDAIYGTFERGRTKHAMGKQSFCTIGNMAFRAGDCLPGKKISRDYNLRDQLYYFGLYQVSNHIQPVPG